MEHLTIANFKFGLDTRKSELSSQPGTLQTAENGHINEGGEFEKRMAFVRTALPAGCFGLEDTSLGLATFGSNADPGGWAAISTAVGRTVYYQRLQHPAVLDGASYNATYHNMTEVSWSYSFLGSAFASAKFSDGKSFLYYNGVLVESSRNGMVLNGYSTQETINQSLAKNLVANTNTIAGWYGVQTNTPWDFYLTATDGSGAIYSPSGITFSSSVSIVSTNGRLALFAHGNQTAYAGAASNATFTIAGTVGISSYAVRAPVSLGSTIQVYLAGVNAADQVLYNTDNATTATDIKNAINARTALTGYSADSAGAVVTVHAPVPSSANIGGSTVYNQGTLVVDAVNDVTANGNHSFANGTYATPAMGQIDFVQFDNTWTVGDTWSATITPSVGSAFTLGKGRISNTSFVNGHVSNRRVFLANGTQYNFCEMGDPTAWELQNPGAGFNLFSSQFGATDTVQAFADYQGRLAVFGKRSVQIWVTNADPAQFSLQQTLTNIGVVAPFSVQSFGELDVYFLSSSGVRSLRVRDSSLNAFVVDIGSPVDTLVKAAMSDVYNAAACSVMEPVNNRFWLFLKDRLYVLSNYPTLRITAWSTYLSTYRTTFSLTVTASDGNGYATMLLRKADGTYAPVVLTPSAGLNTAAMDIRDAINVDTAIHGYVAASVGTTVTITPPTGVANLSSLLSVSVSQSQLEFTLVENQAAFVPTKLVVSNGQIYARDANAIYAYGGSSGSMYDGCVATIELPWLDHKRPFVMKSALMVDVAMKGGWTVHCGMDPRDSLQVVVPAQTSPTGNATTDSTFDEGVFAFEAKGTHLKFKAISQSTWSGAAVMSGFTLQYDLGQNT